MKTSCLIRKWNGDDLGKASAAISPPSLEKLRSWTGYLFVEHDGYDSQNLTRELMRDEPLTVQLEDGRVGQFRVTMRNLKTGEFSIEGTGPLGRP